MTIRDLSGRRRLMADFLHSTDIAARLVDSLVGSGTIAD
jgi:hypothetical protein